MGARATAMADPFQREIEELTDSLFDESEILVMTTRDDQGRSLPAVLVEHRASGLRVIVEDYPNQRMNAAVARLRLAVRLRNRQDEASSGGPGA